MSNSSAFFERTPTQTRRLDNGLTVIVREDHSAPVVAVVTHVRAGYFDEPDHLVGISHVLEHMYFKGTARRGVGEIARATKAAGGYLNAGTIYDHTSYYTVLPSASLEQALDIQADALQRSAIDDEELRRELLVIIQEANRKLDNPSAVAQETLFETMFDVHRLRRWRIGHEAMLRGFTRDDVWEYYRNLYRAANTIVVIAGDVDPARAFDLAARHYGSMPAGEPVRDQGPDEPVRRGFRYRELTGDITQSYLEWGWRTPGTLHEDTPALDVLATALGHGRASRLYRGVRDAGVVSGITAYNYTPAEIGVFGIGAELDPGDTAAALERTAAVVRAARERPFTGAEAERARNILEARYLRRLETVEGQANLLAEWQAHGDWRLAGAYLDRVLTVDADRLTQVARRYLDPSRLTVLLYRPEDSPEHAGDAETVHDALFGVTAMSPDQPNTAAPPPAVPLRRAPGAAPDRTREEDGVIFYDLEQGARIVIKPRTGSPLLSMALYCAGGRLAERNGTAGMTGLMARTSVRGTRRRSAAQLAEESEALGASISASAGADMLGWSTTVPTRHFVRGLDLLLDAALEPTFPAAEAERERKVMLSGIEQLRDDMHQYPLRLALAAAYADHPYGTAVADLEHSIRGLDVADLSGWHRDRVLRGTPMVLVVGDTDAPDQVAREIAARLRPHLESPATADPPLPEWPPVGRSEVERRDKAQTAIVLAFPGPAHGHDDVHALRVLSAAVSGLGGRLFEELRSRRSLAYAVSASPMVRWLGGAFIGYIGTAPDREAEARSELLRELTVLASQPLPGEDIERARRYLLGSWQIRQQTNTQQLSDLAHALLIGDGLRELREYEDRIRAVDAAHVRAAADRWLRADRMVEATIRGR